MIMIIVTALCGVILWVLIVVVLVSMLFEGLVDGDTGQCYVAGALLLVVLGVTAAGIGVATSDNENPCIRWGATEKTWMSVGKVMMPVTHTPCIQRKNETDK